MIKKLLLVPAALLIVFAFAFGNLYGGEINKTYPKKDLINLKASLGSCKIIKSSDDKIHVNLTYSYEDGVFRPRFSEKPDELDLEEDFSVNNPSGYSHWLIAVPGETKIKFSSGTGGFEAEGVKINGKAETGTGSVDIHNVEGDLKISSGTGSITVVNGNGSLKASTGTGSIKVNGAKGSFEFSSGTGHLDISDVIIAGNSKFSSGTGSVNVELSAGPDGDISLTSGTGNAVLNYEGNPLKGYFELQAKKGIGSIVSPAKFGHEEIISEEHTQYDKKVFRINGEDTPVIRIQTGTGTAELIE